jgi:hypothetical protein
VSVFELRIKFDEMVVNDPNSLGRFPCSLLAAMTKELTFPSEHETPNQVQCDEVDIQFSFVAHKGPFVETYNSESGAWYVVVESNVLGALIYPTSNGVVSST